MTRFLTIRNLILTGVTFLSTAAFALGTRGEPAGERLGGHELASMRGADPSSTPEDSAYFCYEAAVDAANEGKEPTDLDYAYGYDWCTEPGASNHPCIRCPNDSDYDKKLKDDHVVRGYFELPEISIDCSLPYVMSEK